MSRTGIEKCHCHCHMGALLLLQLWWLVRSFLSGTRGEMKHMREWTTAILTPIILSKIQDSWCGNLDLYSVVGIYSENRKKPGPFLLSVSTVDFSKDFVWPQGKVDQSLWGHCHCPVVPGKFLKPCISCLQTKLKSILHSHKFNPITYPEQLDQLLLHASPLSPHIPMFGCNKV